MPQLLQTLGSNYFQCAYQTMMHNFTTLKLNHVSQFCGSPDRMH